MLVPHYTIRLSAAEQQALEALQRAGKTPQQTVRRVTILLLAHAGLSNQAIAAQVGTSRNLVQKWRKRFALYEPAPLLAEEEVAPVARLAALHDLPRSGRPPDSPLARHTVVAVACQGVDEREFGGFSHYSVRDLARLVAGRGEIITMSPSTVQRILTAVVLKPHRLRYFLTRTDPWFAEKMAEILEVYLHPPRRCRILCLDEKTHIQALERLHPALPLRQSLVERQEFEYIRHGTVDLFAAFDVGTGEVFASAIGAIPIGSFATSCARCALAIPTVAGI